MVSIDEIRDVATLRRILFAGGLGFECNRDMTPIPNRRYDGKVLRRWNLWLAGRRARDSTHLFRECERLWSADTFVDFSDGLKTAGSKLRIAPLHYSLFI
jgi:hypothetical protein